MTRGLVVAHDEIIKLAEGERKVSLKVKTRKNRLTGHLEGECICRHSAEQGTAAKTTKAEE